MGVYSSKLTREVRMERMRPADLDRAKAQRPAIYVPFGSLEWHGRQNPVGLDAIKAHEQLVGLAVRAGGVVHPPVFFGVDGGHEDYPYSYMYDIATMQAITAQMLKFFERDGYKTAILLSGHYPNQFKFQNQARDAYLAGGGKMRILSIIEHHAPNVSGDHAALCETSFMLHLHVETVDMSVLEGRPDDVTGLKVKRNWMGDEFRDHPCYGIVGEDPRGNASAELGRQATENLLDYLVKWLDEGK
ncbi:MAG: creatininase family protein [Planctomycetes bacterium]|nr:creatininase family protein [Planctomycetota bacterium]